MANQSALPDSQTAFNTVFDNVRVQVFMHKLASYGRQLHSADDLANALEMAGKLRAIEESQAVKSGRDAGDFYGAANAFLDGYMGGYDDENEKMAAANDAAEYHAASHFMNDPAIYNSILSLKVAEAAEAARVAGIR